MIACNYGDPTCPCKDGDPCHYEGENPMLVPPEYVRQAIKNGLDYQAWAVAMCSLLDEIEGAADGIVSDTGDIVLVHQLLRSRFALSEEHGLEVRFLGPIQIGTA